MGPAVVRSLGAPKRLQSSHDVEDIGQEFVEVPAGFDRVLRRSATTGWRCSSRPGWGPRGRNVPEGRPNRPADARSSRTPSWPLFVGSPYQLLVTDARFPAGGIGG